LQARATGADAVLLIAECLDDANLRRLYDAIVALRMTPLVELYEPANLSRALDLGARLIGVNNRDLHTFQIDLEHTLGLCDRIPADRLLVSESGIRTRADVLRLESAGWPRCWSARRWCRGRTSARRWMSCWEGDRHSAAERRHCNSLGREPSLLPIRQ